MLLRSRTPTPLDCTVDMSQPPDLTESLSHLLRRKKQPATHGLDYRPPAPKKLRRPQPETPAPVTKPREATRSVDSFTVFALVLLLSALLIQVAVLAALA